MHLCAYVCRHVHVRMFVWKLVLSILKVVHVSMEAQRELFLIFIQIPVMRYNLHMQLYIMNSEVHARDS